jgi:hypothetical protein
LRKKFERPLELKPPDQLDAVAGNALDPDQGAKALPDVPPPTRLDLAGDSARLLADAALALFAIYAVLVVFDNFPPRLADPLWLLGLSTALVNSVSIPLVGVVLLHVAASIAPQTNWIHQRRQRISRFARWAAFGFLLLVPLLGFATWRGITNVNNASQKQTAGLTRRANTILAAINNASSPQQLQRSMVALQGPQLRNEDLAQPLPALKKFGTEVVKQALQASLEQLPKANSNAYKPLYIQTLRTALLSLVSFLAFASIAYDPLKQQSLLQSLFRPQSAGFPGLQRGGLFSSISKQLDRFKRSTSKDAAEAQQLADRRRSQKEANRAKKQAERSKSLRDQDVKRSLAQQRKLSQQRERQQKLAERQARLNANKNNRNP